MTMTGSIPTIVKNGKFQPLPLKLHCLYFAPYYCDRNHEVTCWNFSSVQVISTGNIIESKLIFNTNDFLSMHSQAPLSAHCQKNNPKCTSLPFTSFPHGSSKCLYMPPHCGGEGEKVIPISCHGLFPWQSAVVEGVHVDNLLRFRHDGRLRLVFEPALALQWHPQFVHHDSAEGPLKFKKIT